MVLSRTRLRVPAALVAGLLLLTGAGEVLGACYCAHRGGEPMGGHGVERQGAAMADSGDGETVRGHADVHEHGAEHDAASPDEAPSSGHEGKHGADDPASGACLALCALACTVGQGSPPDVTRRAPDLLAGARVAAEPNPERDEVVPAVARPHVLPFSQAPPTKA